MGKIRKQRKVLQFQPGPTTGRSHSPLTGPAKIIDFQDVFSQRQVDHQAQIEKWSSAMISQIIKLQWNCENEPMTLRQFRNMVAILAFGAEERGKP